MDHSKQSALNLDVCPGPSCLIGVTFIKHLCGLDLKNRYIFSTQKVAECDLKLDP